MAAPIGAALAISAVFISTLVPVGAAELQGDQLAVTGPTSTTSTVAPAATPAGATTPGAPTTAPAADHHHDDGAVLPVARSRTGRRRRHVQAGQGPARRRLHRRHARCRAGTGSAPVQRADRQRGNARAARSPCRRRSRCSSTRWRRTRRATSARTPTRSSTPGASGWTPTTPTSCVYLARGETFDQEVGGQWQNIGQAGFDSYLVEPLPPGGLGPRLQGGQRRPVDVPVLRQRHVARRHALARGCAGAGDGTTTPPCARWPRPRRRGPTGAGSTCTTSTPRSRRTTPSRRRWTRSMCAARTACISRNRAGSTSAERLAPELAALGQAHADASPGGGWPGPLPPSTPSWFTNLPCQ